jgi:tetratricopeptide (TPR) repeat protein
MKKKLCLLAALILSVNFVACGKVRARMEIKEGNELYLKEQYGEALKHYLAARSTDSGFAELDRLIGYSYIGMFKPEDESPQNAKVADAAITELQKYLRKRPDDEQAREALVNLFLNANRTSQAIDFFKAYLQTKPADLNSVKSIATLYAKQGDFDESLNWYKKITLIDSRNAESHYIYGVVCYEYVAKNPPEDHAEKLQLIEEGKGALRQAIDLRSDYFEALVYLNLLLRQQAQIELDPEQQQELIRQADEIRNRAMAIARERAGKKS